MLDYFRIYKELVDSGRGVKKIPGTHERHHILPRSLGGGEDPSNITVLTYKGHVLAHHLLTRIMTGADKKKMQAAFFKIVVRAEETLPLRLVALARKANSEAKLGNTNASGQRTAESKEKMRGNKNGVGNKGPRGYKYTDTQRAVLKGRVNAKIRAVICLNDQRVFKTIKEAAATYAVHPSNISKVCRGLYSHTGGYKFAYV